MTILTLSFAIALVVTVLVGLLAATRRTARPDEYILSGRDHGPTLTALSSSTSDMSSWVLLGLVGMAYLGGVSVLWVLLAGLLGYSLNWFLVAPRLRHITTEREHLTLPALIGWGPGRTAWLCRALGALVLVVALTLYASAQFTASGKAFEAFFGTEHWWGVLFGALLALPYLIVVGMRGVSWSDAAQSMVVLFAIVGIPIIALITIGGFGEAVDTLRSADPSLLSLTADKTGWEAVLHVAFWISIGLCYPGQPHILARFMAARDHQAVSRGRVIAFSWSQVVLFMAVATGILARAMFPDIGEGGIDGEQSLPILARTLLPAVLAGVALAAVLAAMISTVDSQIFTAVSSVVDDFPALVKRRRLIGFVPRTIVTVAIVGIAATLAAFDPDATVFVRVLDAWTILGAAFGPAIIYSLWSRNTSSYAILAGVATGTIAAISVTGEAMDHRIITSIGSAAIAIVLVHGIHRLSKDSQADNAN